MKRLLVLFGGLTLGAIIFGAGALTLLWLSSDNNVSISVSNSSDVPLHQAAVIVPGSAFSGYARDIAPGETFVIGGELRRSLPVRIVFDAGGRHYDVPADFRLAPFTSYYLSFSIDPKMKVSYSTRAL